MKPMNRMEAFLMGDKTLEPETRQEAVAQYVGSKLGGGSINVLYAGQNNILHYDKELTKPVLKSEIDELFYKGMVVSSASAMGICKPDFFDEFSGNVTYRNGGGNSIIFTATEE